MPEEDAMDLNDEGVEAAAKLIYCEALEKRHWSWEETTEKIREWYVTRSRAAITAYLRAVPESDETARWRMKAERYESVLKELAYDSVTSEPGFREAGACDYFAHDGPRNMLDEDCPGATCWAKRALTPPVTELALSPDEAAGGE